MYIYIYAYIYTYMLYIQYIPAIYIHIAGSLCYTVESKKPTALWSNYTAIKNNFNWYILKIAFNIFFRAIMYVSGNHMLVHVSLSYLSCIIKDIYQVYYLEVKGATEDEVVG